MPPLPGSAHLPFPSGNAVPASSQPTCLTSRLSPSTSTMVELPSYNGHAVKAAKPCGSKQGSIEDGRQAGCVQARTPDPRPIAAPSGGSCNAAAASACRAARRR